MTGPVATEDDFSRCLLMNTIRTARALSRRYDARLKPYGITVIQFSVMMTVRHNEDRTINAISRRIAMDRSTLTRNLDVLVRKGLVVKEKANGGNTKVCRLTGAGDRLLDTLVPKWHEVRAELQDLLKGRDGEEYLGVLRLLAEPD